MKKLILMMLCFGLMLCTVACSNTNESDNVNNSNEDSNQTESTNEEENTAETEDEISDEYNGIKHITDNDIYINYKSGRNDEARTNSHIFYNSGEDAVMVVNGDYGYSGTVEDVFDLLNDGRFITYVFTRVDGEFEISGNYPLVANETENVVVGDIDCVKFTGSVTDEEGLECFAYGYTFVIDETPCMLVGFVFTEEQTEEEKDSIKEEVDIMMTTVRTEM